jgi:hypothetical protein
MVGAMDQSESLVEAYLKAAGYQDIKYEPDGNIPPDFLVDSRIAVEVRRLNQNYDDGTEIKGLEQVAIPLWKSLHKYLFALGPPTHGQSWFVFYQFSRPISGWKTLREKLDAVLLPFMKDAKPKPFKKQLGDSFELEVFKAARAHPTFFVPGGHSDRESGGFLIHEITENLKICIAQKTRKIAQYRARYPEWWLILPDYIGYGLDAFDVGHFREQASIQHTFNKIILVDPRNPSRAFEV